MIRNNIFKLTAGLCVLSFATCACTENSVSQQKDIQISASEKVQTTATASEEAYAPTIFDGIDFGGKEIHLFADKYAGDSFGVFWNAEAELGETVNDAAYRRNRTVEEMLNADLVFLLKNDCKEFNNAVLARTGEYDLMSAVVTDGVNSIMAGTLYDLNKCENIDMSRDWWLSYVNSEISMEGTQYLGCGYFDMGTFARTSAVFFSTKLAETYHLGDLYTLVENDTWTYDKMLSLASSAAVDLNGDGVWGLEDQYGMCGCHNMNAMLIIATGYHFTEINDVGERVLTGCTEKLVDFSNLLRDTYEKEWYFNCYPYKGDNQLKEAAELFTTDHYLFFLQDISYAKQFSGSMDNYGILPVPKYDETQKTFLSYCRPMVSGIPADAPDPEMSALVLEALHCESRKTVYPAYRDIALSNRYASSPEAAEMLDIIFENVCVDFVQMWYAAINLEMNLHNSCGNVQNYTSWYESISHAAEKNLDKLLKTVRSIRDEN